MPTAILIDGAFFIKRIRNLEPQSAYDAKRVADMVCRLALLHLKQRVGYSKKDEAITENRSLYRIFFYDCLPVEKKMHHPLTKKCIDYSKSKEAVFRNELHQELRKKRKLALRLGNLSPDITWTYKPNVIKDLISGKRKTEDLIEDDFTVSFRQKGVDMRIGIDIATLTLKKQVRQIVLFTGDSDFVPAAKLARREGVDLILDPMWFKVNESLHEHIDGLKTTYPKPKPKKDTESTDSFKTTDA
ncbi:NYN domain-containing protein [Dickeya ananatis]|uniref:NYN domain-containing protein n=1 Tax=Dickeya ananatis TaxID=3061286 RepID=UPI001CE59C8A|nr:NYN domain-containing protein [Dickeya zeae]